MENDKTLVILCTTLLAMTTMWLNPEASDIVGMVVSGLFGVAVGKAL